MDGRHTGLLLIGLGAAAVLVGVGVYFGLFRWFGRLPGDIRVEGEHVRFYFPLASCIVISIVLAAVAWLLRKLL